MRAKRFFDVVVSLALLLALAPLMLGLSIAIAITMGCPVVFYQERKGWKSKKFRIWKFRTMTDRRDSAGRLLPDEERITPLGRVLRDTSLDELPQLINVLLGSMSLVGPRPLLDQYLEDCAQEHLRRFEVRPGITGLAQVNGRKSLSYPDRFAYDVTYVDNRSLWLDFKIILATPSVALSRDGTCEWAEDREPVIVLSLKQP